MINRLMAAVLTTATDKLYQPNTEKLIEDLEATLKFFKAAKKTEDEETATAKAAELKALYRRYPITHYVRHACTRTWLTASYNKKTNRYYVHDENAAYLAEEVE